MNRTPNFTGWHAVILHREDANTERLTRQFGLLGIRATRQWEPLSTWDGADIVLVDADQGWDGLLPWNGETPSRPVVALLGSEAPGRIAWALKQGASAVIAKPVAASAVYLEERVRMRPLVHAAVEKLMAARGLDEERAYAILRDCAMRRRLSMEQIAAILLGGSEPLPEVG
jgi:AmiR/NasT family two-component response regulator